MNLSDITPVILTYNEAPNIGRCLEKLMWAKDIVVVDSFSTDETAVVLGMYPRVRLFQKVFDSHSRQWNFAIRETNIKTVWVLALDADYILTDEFVTELTEMMMRDDVDGADASFLYKVNGKVLRTSMYPPVTVLYRRKKAFYKQDGHTQRVVLQGRTAHFKSIIFHDDRKSFRRWLSSQEKYAKEEALKLCSMDWKCLNWKDRLRKFIIPAPVLIFFFGLFAKGLIWDGWPGLVYCVQRFLAEFLLSVNLIKGFFHNDHYRA